MAGYRQKLAQVFLTTLLAAAGPAAFAAEADSACLACHDSEIEPAVASLNQTVHGHLPDDGGCTSCHGASEDHMLDPTGVAPDVSFGPQHPAPAAARNGQCLTCHGGGQRTMWMGSEHEQDGMACTDCHGIHQAQGPLPDKKATTELCTSCHSAIRAELHLPSRHPIAEGKTACTDCHNPHGGAGEALLREVSVNDNCVGCHPDKRGPFLWEHEPVSEDCTLCHRPHGSVHDELLTTQGPALCQQCHSAAFHPSQPYGAEGLASGSASPYVLGKNCLNCHSQIHGSNHPSGARLTR